jgi:8-amino-7-oxononanoate synthase
VIGDHRETLAVSRRLAERGVLVPAIRPPTVPEGTARLRISLSAAHSVDDVERLAAALNELERAVPD